MTIERAIEILDPEHREHYESIEPVNEACRMGMDALKELAELKEKIESGTLKEINYPCYVSDKVFVIRSKTSNNKNFYIFEDFVTGLKVDKSKELRNSFLFIELRNNTSVFEWNFDNVFITREAAEARLKELQEK